MNIIMYNVNVQMVVIDVHKNNMFGKNKWKKHTAIYLFFPMNTPSLSAKLVDNVLGCVSWQQGLESDRDWIF